MIHIAFHFIIPFLIAVTFYRSRWGNAMIIMIATMIVDLDHLLADPIYDPSRCSIGFHHLHSVPAICFYAALFLIPLVMKSKSENSEWHPKGIIVHLVGLGLLIHMALDWIDCVL